MIQHLCHEDFKRATGVQRHTFEKMLTVVEEGLGAFGRPPKLSRADQWLLTLMYWREYRTAFHISLAYEVSEATVCRTIQKVEKALLASQHFHLPGKKTLHSQTISPDVVVDATEQPVERPKKDNVGLTGAKRNVTRRKPR